MKTFPLRLVAYLAGWFLFIAIIVTLSSCGTQGQYCAAYANVEIADK